LPQGHSLGKRRKYQPRDTMKKILVANTGANVTKLADVTAKFGQ